MDKPIYTIFTGGAFYTSFLQDRPKTLEGMVDYVIKTGGKPTAWAAEGTKSYGGTKHVNELRSESVEAGRTFDLINGKYVPKNHKDAALKDAPTKEAWPFRIGGIYKTLDGQVVRLDKFPHGFSNHQGASEGYAFGTRMTPTGTPTHNLGLRQLKDGIYPAYSTDPTRGGHLLPGEVDLKGNPLVQTSIGAPKAKAKGSEKTEEGASITLPDGHVLDSNHPADVAMMKNDGPAKAKKTEAAPEEKPISKVKPAIAGLTFTSDIGNTPHLVKPFHGSAFLH